jgi:hypothetical protein
MKLPEGYESVFSSVDSSPLAQMAPIAKPNLGIGRVTLNGVSVRQKNRVMKPD